MEFCPERLQIRFPVNYLPEKVVITDKWADKVQKERHYQWKGFTVFAVLSGGSQTTMPVTLEAEGAVQFAGVAENVDLEQAVSGGYGSSTTGPEQALGEPALQAFRDEELDQKPSTPVNASMGCRLGIQSFLALNLGGSRTLANM